MPGVSLTEPIRALLTRLETTYDGRGRIQEDETALEVDSVLSGATLFYEKIRYLVDYREEHTIRRSAIERILKRRYLLESQPVYGDELLKELAEGQYLPKESLTEEAARRVSDILSRYGDFAAHGRSAGRFDRRLLSFAATEIENLFAGEVAMIDDAVCDALYETLRPHVSVHGTSDETIDTQLYCAVRRSLLNADTETLSYALWRRHLSAGTAPGTILPGSSPDLASAMEAIERGVKHPLQWQLSAKIKNESIYFQILRALLHRKRRGAEWVLNNTKDLDAFTRSFLEEKYVHENEKLQASGIRAVVYLFFTKILAALAFELPYELLILGQIHYFPLLTNTLFHPFLLFIATRGVDSLDHANTEAIIRGMHDAFYDGKVRRVRIESQSSALMTVFGFIYFLLICALLSGIIGILTTLGFNVVSMILFVFFLSLVSYFAFRIRYNAQRWKVAGTGGPVSLFVHVAAVPIVRVGRWLSQKFSTVNVFVLFMDFILETPFKLLLGFSSKFFVYLREKADDVY